MLLAIWRWLTGAESQLKEVEAGLADLRELVKGTLPPGHVREAAQTRCSELIIRVRNLRGVAPFHF